MKPLNSLAAAAFAVAASALTIMTPAAASAAMSAVAIAGVNMRAGPSTQYPAVATLPPNAALSVYGCTANTSWCDVSWGRNRGWVSANYVQVFYRGTPTIVTPAVVPAVGITVVTFNRAYWNSYYVGRPWYGQWDAYYRPGYVAAGRGPYGAGYVAAGHCGNGSCSGGAVARGPGGRVWVRRGTTSW